VLSPVEIEKIEAEIAELEKALADCADGGGKECQDWIADLKDKLSKRVPKFTVATTEY
jgi:hypothetical protein